MARQPVIGNTEILEAALLGYQSQLSRIDEAIAGIRSRLGIRGQRPLPTSSDGLQPAPARRKISAAARKRISEATRKRWQAYRAQKAESAKPARKPKRKLSAAGRAAIIAATKKRWAAVHKAQKAAAKKATSKRKATKAAPKRLKASVLASITPVLAPVMP